MATDSPKVSAEIEKDITEFDSSKLKHTETVEKQSLPSPDVISQEKTIQNIAEFDKSCLKKAETTEKNTLPSKEVIQEEKRASLSS